MSIKLYCLFVPIIKQQEKKSERIFLTFLSSLVAQSFSWCGKCVRLHVSYLSALMLLCPLQQDSKKRVVENGQKSIYICKTEFSLVFCHRFSGSGLYILSCYLYYFSCLLTLLLTSLATVLRYGQKTRHLKIQQETYPPWKKR